MEDLLNRVPSSFISIQQQILHPQNSDYLPNPTEHHSEEFTDSEDISQLEISRKFLSKEIPPPKFIDALSPQLGNSSDITSSNESENINESDDREETSRLKKNQFSSSIGSPQESNGFQNPNTTLNELTPSFNKSKKGKGIIKPTAKSAGVFFHNHMTFSKDSNLLSNGEPGAHQIIFKKIEMSPKNSPRVNIEFTQPENKVDDLIDEEDRLAKENKNTQPLTTTHNGFVTQTTKGKVIVS